MAGVFGSLGRSQAKFRMVFIGIGILLAVIFAGVGNEKMSWKTSIVDLWVAQGTRVEQEMSWLNSSEIDALGHFSVELLLSEKVDTDETPTKEDVFDKTGMTAHRRIVDIMLQTEVEHTFERIEGGQRKSTKETFSYDDFCWNLYPYSFQCIRPSPMDCFKEGGTDFPLGSSFNGVGPVKGVTKPLRGTPGGENYVALAISTTGPSMADALVTAGALGSMYKNCVTDSTTNSGWPETTDRTGAGLPPTPTKDCNVASVAMAGTDTGLALVKLGLASAMPAAQVDDAAAAMDLIIKAVKDAGGDLMKFTTAKAGDSDMTTFVGDYLASRQTPSAPSVAQGMEALVKSVAASSKEATYSAMAGTDTGLALVKQGLASAMPAAQVDPAAAAMDLIIKDVKKGGGDVLKFLSATSGDADANKLLESYLVGSAKAADAVTAAAMLKLMPALAGLYAQAWQAGNGYMAALKGAIDLSVKSYGDVVAAGKNYMGALIGTTTFAFNTYDSTIRTLVKMECTNIDPLANVIATQVALEERKVPSVPKNNKLFKALMQETAPKLNELLKDTAAAAKVISAFVGANTDAAGYGLSPYNARTSFTADGAKFLPIISGKRCTYWENGAIYGMMNMDNAFGGTIGPNMGADENGNFVNRTKWLSKSMGLEKVLGIETIYNTINDKMFIRRMAGLDDQDQCKVGITSWQRRGGYGLPAVDDITEGEAKEIRQKLLRKIERSVIAESRSSIIKNGVRSGPYLSTSLTDEFDRGQGADVFKFFVGYLLILAYVILTLSSFQCDMVQSRILVAVASVLTVVLGVTGGIGLAGLFGIAMTQAAQSVLPLFLLGIGLNDIFVLSHNFPLTAATYNEPTGDVMERFLADVGPSVTLTSVSNVFVFFVASFIPIPLVTEFAQMSAVVMAFIWMLVLFVFPAFLALDHERRSGNRMDCAPCVVVPPSEQIEVPQSTQIVTTSAKPRPQPELHEPTNSCLSTIVHEVYAPLITHPIGIIVAFIIMATLLGVAVDSLPDMEQDLQLVDVINKDSMIRPAIDMRFNHFASYTFTAYNREIALHETELQHRYYGSYERTIFGTPSQQVLDSTKSFLYSFYAWAEPETKCDLTQKVRLKGTCSNRLCETQGSSEPVPGSCGPAMAYLKLPDNAPLADGDKVWDAATKTPGFGCNFGLYQPPADMAEKGYPLNTIPYTAANPRYRNSAGAFAAIGWDEDTTAQRTPTDYNFQICLAKDDPTYLDWMSETEKGKTRCYAMPEKTVKAPRSVETPENPGIHKYTSYGFNTCFALYHKYSIGGSLDQRYVRYQQRNRKTDTCFKSSEMDLPVFVKSPLGSTDVMPLTYTGHTAVGLENGKAFVHLIKEVRAALLKDPKLVGDPNNKEDSDVFPSGVPFIFWEQYVTLDQQLLEKGGAALGVSFGCVFLLFLVLIEKSPSGHDSILLRVVASAWGALIMALFCIVTVIQMYGFMAIMKIKLNAIPMVTLIMAIGLSVEFTAHTILAYMNAPHHEGNGWLASRRERTMKAFDRMAVPTLHGSVTTTLGIVMLSASDSNFIFLYYFTLYGLLVFFGTVNGLVVLGAVLALCGPTPTRFESVQNSQPTQIQDVEAALTKK